jgi:predicted ATPase/class 3 adenylate cyclase
MRALSMVWGVTVTDLRTWLAAARLADLHDALVANGVDLAVLPDLTEADLLEIGLNVGQRRRLQKAIAEFGNAPPGQTARAVGERRQLTVMFIDLVGSTELAVDRDAEDLRDIIWSYCRCCAEVVERHGGTVAQYLGDGVLVYFGYPLAGEHSAERAVRAGLAVIGEAAGLNLLPGRRLRTRVGAATGMVVVGKLAAKGLTGEPSALGGTPHLAARLQAIAEPDTLVIADSTRELVGNLFDCRPLGALTLKGFSQPVAAHQVLREREVENRFRAAREGRVLPPLEGRSEELAALGEIWDQAARGLGGAVLVAGEAGMGKSRLMVALAEHVAEGAGQVVALSCQPQFRNTALQPLLAFLQRTAGIARDDPAKVRFGKVADLLDCNGIAASRALFATMLKIPAQGLYEVPAESPEHQRQSFFGAVAELMLALGQGAPVLVCIEDLHWADPTTLEFVGSLLDHFTARPALLLATTRSDARPALAEDPRTRLVSLDGLSVGAVEAIVAWITGGLPAPAGLVELIWRQSDGNPLFVEELTKTLLESRQLREEDGRLVLSDSLTRIAIPATLHDSLMARLDRLAAAKEVAQIGATIGREFSLDLMAAVCPHPPKAVVAGLGALEAAEILFEQRGAGQRTWYFKHALIQDAAYESLLRSRRRELHARIAEAIATRTPEEAGLHPEVMAHHLSRAGHYLRAVDFGIKAGMTALTRSANAEAIGHARACLDWLRYLPEGEERERSELGVNAMLTPALMVARGYASAEVEASATRALQLIDSLGDRPEMFPVIYCLKQFHHVRSERSQARALAERLMAMAERAGNSSQQAAGLGQLAQCCWIEGDPAGAERFLRRAIALYDVEQHRQYAHQYGFDFLTYSRITLSQVLWITGRSTEAVREAEAALAHAREINHANSVAMALLYGMIVRQQRGERAKVAELGRETQAYCGRMGVTTPRSYAAMIANWASGDVEGSLGIFDVHAAVGAHLGMTYYRSLAAENAVDAGRLDVAIAILEPALQQAASAGERYWEPQLLRLRARIARSSGEPDGVAAGHLELAVGKANAMGAHMLEALALLDLLELSADRGTGRLAELLGGLGVELPADAAARAERLGLYDFRAAHPDIRSEMSSA